MGLFSKIKDAINAAAEEQAKKKAEEAARLVKLEEEKKPYLERLSAGDGSAAEELYKLVGGRDTCGWLPPDHKNKQDEYLRAGAKLGNEYCRSVLFNACVDWINSRIKDRILIISAKDLELVYEDMLMCVDLNDEESTRYKLMVTCEYRAGVQFWNSYADGGTDNNLKTAAYKWFKRAAKHGNEEADANIHSLF